MITRDITWDDVKVGSTGRSGSARVSLTWSSERAWEIAMRVNAGGDDITWTFDRDLLVRGLLEVVGHGDVVVNPLGQFVAVVLRTPLGRASLNLPRVELSRYLDDTTEIVPCGEEVVQVPDFVPAAWLPYGGATPERKDT